MNKKINYCAIIIITFILLVSGIFIFGFVGGQEAKDTGITCDMGLGNNLCWKWHTNTLGEAQEFIDNLFGDNQK